MSNTLVVRQLTGTAPLGDAARCGLVAGAMPAHLRHLSADEKPMAQGNLACRKGLSGRSREGLPSQSPQGTWLFW
jgi:hypothetical protein